MVKFALFFSYTDDTWACMLEAPTDRFAALRAMVEQLGGALESLYYIFGDHDGVAIFDAPDADAAAAVAPLVTSTGAFRSAKTHQLIPSSDLHKVLAKAASARGVRPRE